MLPVDSWSGLALVEPVDEGDRNEVNATMPSRSKWGLAEHG